MVLVGLVAFFAAVAGVNAVMIWAAVSTFGGVETESSYQAGLVAAQDALHWQVKAKVSGAAGVTLVEVVAADGADRPVSGLQAVARLVHPSDKRADHLVVLNEGAPGQFRGHSGPLVGQWALVIELSREGTRIFRSKNRIFLR